MLGFLSTVGVPVRDMGFEYQIETYDADRPPLAEYLKRCGYLTAQRADRLDVFLGREGGGEQWPVSIFTNEVGLLISMPMRDQESFALIGRLITHLTEGNDQVVIWEV